MQIFPIGEKLQVINKFVYQQNMKSFENISLKYNSKMLNKFQTKSCAELKLPVGPKKLKLITLLV